MRCFACDKQVLEGFDKKTDRWYCFDCYEATNQVLMKQLDDEMDSLFGTSEKTFLEMDEWADTPDKIYVPQEDERLFEYE